MHGYCITWVHQFEIWKLMKMCRMCPGCSHDFPAVSCFIYLFIFALHLITPRKLLNNLLLLCTREIKHWCGILIIIKIRIYVSTNEINVFLVIHIFCLLAHFYDLFLPHYVQIYSIREWVIFLKMTQLKMTHSRIDFVVRRLARERNSFSWYGGESCFKNF